MFHLQISYWAHREDLRLPLLKQLLTIICFNFVSLTATRRCSNSNREKFWKKGEQMPWGRGVRVWVCWDRKSVVFSLPLHGNSNWELRSAASSWLCVKWWEQHQSKIGLTLFTISCVQKIQYKLVFPDTRHRVCNYCKILW